MSEIKPPKALRCLKKQQNKKARKSEPFTVSYCEVQL